MDSFFRSLFDALPDSIAVLDDEGEIIFVNKSWKDFGESNGLLTTCAGINYIELCNSMEGDCAEKAGEAGRGIALILAQNREEFILEYPCDSPDKERWFLMRAQKFLHEGGIHILIHHQDITGLKRAEMGIDAGITERKTLIDSLLRTEEREKFAQSAANFGTWDWDIKESTLEWSDSIEPMFGLRPGEFRGTYDAFLECVHPDDRQSVIDAVNASLEKDAPYEISHRILWPDGSIRWFLEKGTVFRDGEGKAHRMVGVVQDITDRKTLDESLHLLERCIEQAFDCIIITDLHGRIKYANPAFELLSGYTGSEVIDHNTKMFKSGKHDKAFYRAMWDTILNGRTWNGTLINRKKDGTIYHEEMTIAPVKNNNGKLENFIAIKRDITERNLLQDEIRRLQHEYEAFMRHELKNLLAPIKSYSDLLLHYEQEGMSDKQKLFVTRLKESADRTLGLIDNLRKLHDFESGTYNLDAEDADVIELVNTAVYDLKPLAGEYAVDVRVNDNPLGHCVVSVDRTLFPGVLHNLLKNAIEHVMYETDASQKIVILALAKEFNTAVIRINNRGEPIRREKLELFFEKFNSDRKKKGGTGLGTTYAYLVTKAHGGDIFVQSNERDGITVTVILPCR